MRRKTNENENLLDLDKISNENVENFYKASTDFI
jgi:hypothetical protein